MRSPPPSCPALCSLVPGIHVFLKRKQDVDSRNNPRRGGGSPGHDGMGRAVQTDFAQVVYEHLKTAGVRNTKKGETLKFEWHHSA